MIQTKHGVFNCLTGQYDFLDSKDEVGAKVVENALALYFAQTNGHHYYCANITEEGHEVENGEESFGTELPQDLLDAYISTANENVST